jgi:antitoxin component YwqK of YwqJK toxin-antitoxin module
MEIMRYSKVAVFSLLIIQCGVAQQLELESESEYREWTSALGTKIDAEVISADHTEVILKTRNKKILKLHPGKLSQEDQNFLKEKFPPSPLAEKIIGKRLSVQVADWPVTALFQFELDGKVKLGSLKRDKVIQEKDGLTYKIDGLIAKVFDNDKIHSLLKFASVDPESGTRMTFGPEKSPLSGTILSIVPAFSFNEVYDKKDEEPVLIEKGSVNINTLEKRDGIYYEPGAFTSFSGKVYRLSTNGKKAEEVTLKYGQREGLQRNWYFNGQQQSKSLWKNGKKDGAMWEWHENDQKKSEMIFKRDQLISKKEWDDEGGLIEE